MRSGVIPKGIFSPFSAYGGEKYRKKSNFSEKEDLCDLLRILPNEEE